MKLFTLPKIKCELNLNDDVYNQLVNSKLFLSLSDKKKEIDTVQYKWDSAKKISNDFEYIYTSSNTKKNVSSIIPVSRSFFKLREIMFDFKFPIYDQCACIAEAPGGFMQSILKLCEDKKFNVNQILGITLISEDKDIPYWNPNLLNNPIIKTCSGKDGSGDLYKLHNIVEFINNCGKTSCSLVTADGGFDYTKDFEQELSSYKLLYSEIMIALNIQAVNGTFVCKMFDLFWYSTIQLIYVLYISYESISFIKPSTSRASNSEKYIVCRGFKGYNKELSNLFCQNFGKDKLPIVISDKFLDILNQYNTQFVKNQILRINNTLKLISERRILDKPTKSQIKLAKEWCIKYEIPINKYCYYL